MLQDVGDGLEHNCFAPVTDEGLAALLGCKLRPHPDKVAEAAALASVRAPNLKYSLCLPKEILLSEPSFLSACDTSFTCTSSFHRSIWNKDISYVAVSIKPLPAWPAQCTHIALSCLEAPT